MVDRQSKKVIAYFYLDAFARPGEKRDGAWMDECICRTSAILDPQTNEPRKPIAYLVCNQQRPSGSEPAVTTFREITTLFHEFGHGLQHMLTQVNDGDMSGINGIEWDAVELPSQFMENWCYQPDVLKRMSCHVRTGEVIPDELITRLQKSRVHMAGMIVYMTKCNGHRW